MIGCNLKKNFFFQRFYLLLGQRETEHERGRGRERGRHRIGNRLQAPSHQPRARRGARTHGPRDRDLAEVGRLTDCATQAPLILFFLIEHPPTKNIPCQFSSPWEHSRSDSPSPREYGPMSLHKSSGITYSLGHVHVHTNTDSHSHPPLRQPAGLRGRPFSSEPPDVHIRVYDARVLS